MPNRCVIDRKLRFEFARDLEQTIFHAFTLRQPNSERELDDEEFVKERCLATRIPLSLIREFLGGSGPSKTLTLNTVVGLPDEKAAKRILDKIAHDLCKELVSFPQKITDPGWLEKTSREKASL